MALDGKIAFLGFGNMAEAIASGLITSGTILPRQAIAHDVVEVRREVAEKLGINWAESTDALTASADYLLLATKPQDMALALDALRTTIRPESLVISIAAGISISFLQERLGHDARIARVMPNTPALVGAGAAGIALSETCTDADRRATQTIFDAIGIAEFVDESQIDAVTALSGSGPAYFFLIVECLVDAAKAEGLSESAAVHLAAQTCFGAGKLLISSEDDAATLRARVTSKGGTTHAAIEQFKADDLPAIIRRAVAAAAARSRELGM